MNKTFYILFLLSAVIFTSCQYNEPEIVIHNSRIFMYVGDYVGVKVEGGKDIQIQYSESRDAASPVFEAKIQNDKNNPILIHALHAGTDTLMVGYRWNAGIFAYGHQNGIIVTVLENQ